MTMTQAADYLACAGQATADHRVCLEMHYHAAACEQVASPNKHSSSRVRQLCACMQVRPGLPEGTHFVFEREGDVGPKNKAGPVAYVLSALPHARFSSRGSDLLYTAQIPLYQALCGTALPVETLDGRCVHTHVTAIVCHLLLRPAHDVLCSKDAIPLGVSSLLGNCRPLHTAISMPSVP